MTSKNVAVGHSKNPVSLVYLLQAHINLGIECPPPHLKGQCHLRPNILGGPSITPCHNIGEVPRLQLSIMTTFEGRLGLKSLIHATKTLQGIITSQHLSFKKIKSCELPCENPNDN